MEHANRYGTKKDFYGKSPWKSREAPQISRALASVRSWTFYAKQFSALEINYTWYQMPKAEAMARMIGKVPDGFVFSVKFTRTMTHEIDPKNWRTQAELFRHGVAPLIIARRLRAILIHLGPAFDRTRENRIYLARLLDALDTLPLVVEFRHRSWLEDRVFIELERRRVALAIVDVPDLR